MTTSFDGIFGRVIVGAVDTRGERLDLVQLFRADGTVATRLPATNGPIWPFVPLGEPDYCYVPSQTSATYEHPEGLVITARDAVMLGIEMTQEAVAETPKKSKR